MKKDLMMVKKFRSINFNTFPGAPGVNPFVSDIRATKARRKTRGANCPQISQRAQMEQKFWVRWISPNICGAERSKVLACPGAPGIHRGGHLRMVGVFG